MSAQTKDYAAHRHQVGRVQYVATVIKWPQDIEERVQLAERTFPNLGLAKAWAAKEIPKRVAGSVGDVWPEIRRGEWTDDRIDDDEFGTVHDLCFEFDESWGCDGWLDGSVVEWSEWS